MVRALWWLTLLLGFQWGGTSPCPGECVCQDDQQVSCQAVGLTDIPLDVVPTVTTLDLTGNKISQIGLSSLAEIRGVVNLILKNNLIEHIEEGAFALMTNLQSLDLSGNNLHNIHQGTFSGVVKLLHLDLSNNKLERVDGAFASMAELTRLDLRDNRLQGLTQFTFRDLTSLRYLLVADNEITHVDRRAFRNLQKLMYLVLKGNPVGNADNIEFASPYLSYVDYSECGLRYVPRGLPNSIRYLQLRRNNMTVIHKRDLGEVPYVSILVLDENGITFLEDGTFAPMIYLQQLWLNGNKLTMVPRPLPASLQRLLMDSNEIGAVTDIFPEDSKLHTLSFMGNNISYISPYACRKLPDLRSLDLSNNLLESLYSDTFINSTQLKTLQLSKNPLKYFYSRCFHGLTNLRTLTLAYIESNATLHDDIFEGLEKLKKLDLDSSPGIINDLLNSDVLLESLKTVEDLSMQSAEITHLRLDFPLKFPNLKVLHLTSSRWHCDTTMMWFKDWLGATSVQIPTLDQIVCFSPRSLHGEKIMSLPEDQFVIATTTDMTTQVKTFPPITAPTPFVGPDEDDLDFLIPHLATPRNFQPNSLPSSFNENFPLIDTEGSGFDHSDEDDTDNVDLLEDIFFGYDESSTTRLPTWEEYWARTSTKRSREPDKKYHPWNVGDNLKIQTLPGLSTLDPAIFRTTLPPDKEGLINPNSLLIVIVVVIVTVLLIAVLVTAIVFCCKKKNAAKNKDAYANAIKYKQRNDVLYFMPQNGTVEGATTDSLSTSNSKDQMSLVPGRDINHEGPLRMYKWEDF